MKPMDKLGQRLMLGFMWCALLLVGNLIWLMNAVYYVSTGSAPGWTVVWQISYILWLLPVGRNFLKKTCLWPLTLSLCALILAEGTMWILRFGVPLYCGPEIPCDQLYLATLSVKVISLIVFSVAAHSEFTLRKQRKV